MSATTMMQAQQTREVMNNPARVRNLSVVAHVDHGKSTITDLLVKHSGVANKDRFADNLPEESERGTTIKSTGVTLLLCRTPSYSSLPDTEVLINLVDSPGHVDFSSEMTGALRVTDGALVIVDCMEGMRVQTETVLRQALMERVRPVLLLNKLDRVLTEVHMDQEACYQTFVKILADVNDQIETYSDGSMDYVSVKPEDGTVVFGSGLHSWAFSLQTFARMYASRFGFDEKEMVSKLWGDWYFDSKTSTFVESPVTESGRALPRTFCLFVLDPIYKLFRAVEEKNEESIASFIEKMSIKLSLEERALEGKAFLRLAMARWLPAADTLVALIVDHLPSPTQAQSYRVDTLYTGPPDDRVATGIRNCDPNGPVVVYISKMLSDEEGKSVAFGRVFSGTVRTGGRYRVLGSGYTPDSMREAYNDKAIQRTVIVMGWRFEAVDDVPAGNTVGLVGIENYLLKTATVTDDPGAHIIHTMKFSVSPVVSVAVRAKNTSDSAKLVDGLRRLSQSDMKAVCTIDETTNEHTVAASCELHLQVSLGDLERVYAKVEIVASEPVVSYAETVVGASAEPALAKSFNKHNRIWSTAEPLEESLTAAIVSGKLSAVHEPKALASALTTIHGWTPPAVNKLWALGPDGNGPNTLVDSTTSVDSLHEVKNSIVDAFQRATCQGVLCGEPLRGVRFLLSDATLHSNSAHRGAGQVRAAALRSFHAAQLSALPRLMEPVLLLNIRTVDSSIGAVYGAVSARGGTVMGEEPREGTPIVDITAHLSVRSSFGFPALLLERTSGSASINMSFSHYVIIDSDPLDPTSEAGELVRAVRLRKGMKAEVPAFADIADQL